MVPKETWNFSLPPKRKIFRSSQYEIDVFIKMLGARGDGIAETEMGTIFVPFAAPGDCLRVKVHNRKVNSIRANIVDILSPAEKRQQPICQHFSECGGCAVQHVVEDSYLNWKRSLVCNALHHRGLDSTTVNKIIGTKIGQRRHARFHAQRTSNGVVLGYLGARSHRIVSISQCPILVPAIEYFLPLLPPMLSNLLKVGEAAEVGITRCINGLDILIAKDENLDLTDREILVEFANTHDLARVSWKPLKSRRHELPEIIIRRYSSMVDYSGIDVEIPPGGFVQPTAIGEEILREFILEHLGRSRSMVDLFSGCGAFSLPIAATGASVLAVDFEPDQIAALDQAARRVNLRQRLRTQIRNLNRNPLSVGELENFDCVLLDPPRQGAKMQVTSIAKSTSSIVIYISCNPVSFARDARILSDGGLVLKEVLPVDQFLYTPHLEIAAYFSREG